MKWLGWLIIPYIMIFFQWRKLGKVGKSVGGAWAAFSLVITIISRISGNSNPPQNQQASTPVFNNSAPKTDSSQTQAPPSPPNPTYSISSDNGTFKGVKVSNVGIAISGVDTADSVGMDGMSTTADGKFVIIHLLVKNEQNDAITLDSNEFNIIDSQGKKYSSSINGATYYSMQRQNEKLLFLNQLNPGVITKGFVIYDVPKDLDLSTVQLEARGGFTGDTAKLPLAVQNQ